MLRARLRKQENKLIVSIGYIPIEIHYIVTLINNKTITNNNNMPFYLILIVYYWNYKYYLNYCIKINVKLYCPRPNHTIVNINDTNLNNLSNAIQIMCHWAQQMLIFIRNTFAVVIMYVATNFTQFNCRKTRKAMVEIVERHHELNGQNYIYALQEPLFSTQGKLQEINFGKLYRYDKKPRACIITDPRIDTWGVPEFSDRDMATICFKDGTQLKYATSVYMPYEEKEINPKLKLLSDFCKRISKPLLILADSNSHLTLTGPDMNKRGQMLEDFLFDNDLQLANDGLIPTFQTSWCKTFIDITAHNHYLEQPILNWRVDPRESFSDHKFIQFEVECEIISEDQILNFKKANWKIFDKYINKNIHRLNKPRQL
jgi:hypothetical protein